MVRPGVPARARQILPDGAVASRRVRSSRRARRPDRSRVGPQDADLASDLHVDAPAGRARGPRATGTRGVHRRRQRGARQVRQVDRARDVAVRGEPGAVAPGGLSQDRWPFQHQAVLGHGPGSREIGAPGEDGRRPRTRPLGLVT